MYSNNSQGGGFGSLFANIPPVTKNLLLINIAVFAVMAIVPGAEAALDRWCAPVSYTHLTLPTIA